MFLGSIRYFLFRSGIFSCGLDEKQTKLTDGASKKPSDSDLPELHKDA